MVQAEDVLSFWFGPAEPGGWCGKEVSQRWYKKDEAFDRAIEQKFRATHEAAVAGSCDAWLASPDGCLAVVILLDQFSRNMFRGTPGMFASDVQALEIAKEGMKRGDHLRLEGHRRSFFYMPLMHSEALADQEECVRLFAEMVEATMDSGPSRVEGSLDFAKRHRDIVLQFGRFPHRNEVLGRESTAEEAAFLRQPGSGF